MRIIICGGRHYTNNGQIAGVLHWLDAATTTIITGDATGTDDIANTLAVEMGFKTEIYPALWSIYGTAAGPIRNQNMLNHGCDKVIAFPGGRGTAHMVSIARRANVPVLAIKE